MYVFLYFWVCVYSHVNLMNALQMKPRSWPQWSRSKLREAGNISHLLTYHIQSNLSCIFFINVWFDLKHLLTYHIHTSTQTYPMYWWNYINRQMWSSPRFDIMILKWQPTPCCMKHNLLHIEKKHQGIKDVSSLIWATFILSSNIVSELCGGVRPIWIYVSSWDSSDPNTWDPDAQ